MAQSPEYPLVCPGMTMTDTLDAAPMGELSDWPLFGMTDDVRPAMAAAVLRGERLVLATLIQADGGSPRPPGSLMMFTDRAVSGFFSGGCVEGDVAAHARSALADGRARRLVYGEGSPWPDIRLLCGARIEILLEPMGPDDPALAALLTFREARRPALWRTDGDRRACGPDASRESFAQISVEASPFEVRLVLPPQKRMIVVGGDPTALAITRLAQDMGYETHLVRPKGPEQAPAGLGATYWRTDAPAALEAIGLDPWTYVAVATHDTDTDEAALAAALPSPARYVGVLGARRRLPERLARLRALGVPEAGLSRMRGPIGLDLGGKAPFEIAVAVMGEVTALASRAVD